MYEEQPHLVKTYEEKQPHLSKTYEEMRLHPTNTYEEMRLHPINTYEEMQLHPINTYEEVHTKTKVEPTKSQHHIYANMQPYLSFRTHQDQQLAYKQLQCNTVPLHTKN